MSKKRVTKLKKKIVRGMEVYQVPVYLNSSIDLGQIEVRKKPKKWRFFVPSVLILAVIAGIALYAVHGEYTLDVELIKDWVGFKQVQDPVVLPPVINPSPEPAPEPPVEGIVPVEPTIVGNEYFEDAVFIGDSRTEGLRIYTGLKNSTFLSVTSLMVDTTFTKKFAPYGTTTKDTVVGHLSQKKYSKVYIMLGVNELGWVQKHRFVNKYGELIDEIRRLQGDPIIYVQSLIPVTKSRSDADVVYNNSGIAFHNQQLVELAAEKGVVYLNVAESVVNEWGVLPEEASKDGIHFTPKYYKMWLEYLKSHTASENPIPQPKVEPEPEIQQEQGAATSDIQPLPEQP